MNAASERFSLLSNQRQTSSLEDFRELSFNMKHNGQKVKHNRLEFPESQINGIMWPGQP